MWLPIDWRIPGFYRSSSPCQVCGNTAKTGIEPRYDYTVCEEHSKLSPLKVSILAHKRILQEIENEYP